MKLVRSPLAPDRFPDLPQVKGVRAATASRGLYAKAGLDRDDVFLFVFDAGTTAAGVFTRSSTASDDVDHCRNALREGGGSARALLVNAGNSNAFTGAFGRDKNKASLSALEEVFGVGEDTCFLAATGVIGEPLSRPDYIAELVPDMAARLAPPDWSACARAFMTTDTFAKASGHASADFAMAGIAKGSGMIAPNMATMLAYIFTDAAIAPDLLDRTLRRTTDQTFNCITVDGDTSTSDTLMVFATGATGEAPIATQDDPRFPEFERALRATAADLAEQIVRDGEGATKLIRVRVEGARSEPDARQVGLAIANSPLVKTALAASDANWGRVVMAVGKSSIKLDPARLRIWFGDHLVAVAGGRAETYDETAASAACAGESVVIRVDLGLGDASSDVLTCDLTHAYIDINGAYRT